MTPADLKHIYQKYYLGLLHYALRQVGLEQAEEIIHDVFVAIWQRDLIFPTPLQLKTFLFKSVRNGCITILRKQADQGKRMDSYFHVKGIRAVLDDAGNFEIVHRENEPADRELLYAELIKQVLALVKSLKPHERYLFKKIILEGKQPASLALQLGKSVQTIKNQKTTALKVVREGVRRMRLETL